MYASYAIAPKVSTNYYSIATLQQSVTMPFVAGRTLGLIVLASIACYCTHEPFKSVVQIRGIIARRPVAMHRIDK